MQPDSRAAGPGAVTQTDVDVKPLLDGASEYDYVEILNPLPVDFVAKFGVSRPVRGDIRIVTNQNTPTVTNDENDIRRNYGLDLRNKDHLGKANIVNRVTIKAGQTIRVLGNEAQVIVNQLVTEIMQRRGKRLMLADPTQRSIIEHEIVRRRDSVESILGRTPVSIQDQLKSAVDSQSVLPEVEFPTVNVSEVHDEVQRHNTGSESPAADQLGGGDTATTGIAKRSVGRPPKTVPAT